MIPYINKSSQEPININMQIYETMHKEIKSALQTAFYLYKPSCFNFKQWLYIRAFQLALLVKNPLNSFFSRTTMYN